MRTAHFALALLALAAIAAQASAAISEGKLQAPRRALTGGKGGGIDVSLVKGYGGFSKHVGWGGGKGYGEAAVVAAPVVVPVPMVKTVEVQPVVVSKGWGKGGYGGGYGGGWGGGYISKRAWKKWNKFAAWGGYGKGK